MKIRLIVAGALLITAALRGVLFAEAPEPQRPPSGAPAGTTPPFGVVAYPPRAPGDPAAIERGKSQYGVNCTFCHGADTRGGDGGGPNLLRSALVLDDQKGELIGPTIRDGRGSMPRFQLSPEQIADIAEFLHSFTVESRSGPSKINILVGDAKQGEAFVAQKCASCHTTAALSIFAARPQLRDPIVLQQMWLMPGSGGGRGGGNTPVPAPPITVTVTMPAGEKIEGTLERMDDFVVTLTQADGRRRTIRTVGTAAKVEVRDPLQPHKDLLKVYSDSDIHNVTAYLASLGKP